VVVVAGRIGPADVPELYARVRAVLARCDAGIVVCDVRALVDPDMGTVDALARLALAGRRHGCRIRLRHATAELRQLLTLAGLVEVVGLSPGLRLERGGQAEQGEHPCGVEEGVDGGDAAV
jgi:hypothetical protein